MAQLNHDDIQGLVLTSYSKNMPCANYILLKITEAEGCRKWLTGIAGKITTGKDRKDDFALNIAFTASGFRALQMPEAELATFSVAFQEGMVSPNRQRILGDTDGNLPGLWTWGNDANPVDMVLLLYCRNEETLQEQLDAIDADLGQNTGVIKIRSLSAGRQPDSKEHFGFLDGVGQPVIEGTGREANQLDRTGHATVVKAGEFILGYDNEMLKADPLPAALKMQDFGKNGTYLVFRQLEQHVADFWNFIDKTTRDTAGQSIPGEQEKLAAKMIGRWKSGAPITKYPLTDPAPAGTNEENDFDFAVNDQIGLGCPVGAHIRRANPRDSMLDDPAMSAKTVRRHRILRRGRSYGDRTNNVYLDDKKERGLHFICINSNIERQFEFIQQMWINNQAFGTLNHETDPLIGHREGQDMFSLPGCPVRTRVQGLPEFVTTKGGAYFFMPGMAAFKALCSSVA